MAEQRKGPLLELMLGGTARDFVREIPFDHKVNGAVMDLDGTGPRHWSGLAIILQALNQNFGHLDEEEATHYLMELYQFRRQAGESMDAYLARFTIMHHRSANILGIALSPGQQAFMLMSGMGMDRRAQWETLRTLNGRLPADEAQLDHIKIQLRRYGHLCESQAGPPGRHYPCAFDQQQQQQQQGYGGMHTTSGPGGWTGNAVNECACGGPFAATNSQQHAGALQAHSNAPHSTRCKHNAKNNGGLWVRKNPQ